MTEKSIIYVGNKPTMNYILAVVTQFNKGSSSILIKARGKSISRAVDVAEIVRNNFILELDVKNIKISTEKINLDDDLSRNVSIIEIELKRD